MQEPNAPRPSIPASWIVAGFACAVVLVAITWLVAGRNNGSRDPDMQQLMSRLDALESRNQGSRPPSGAAGPGAAMPGMGQGGPLGAMGGQMPTPEEVEAKNQERLRTFESRFSQEPADPGASKVEDDMLKGMTDKQLAAADIVPKEPDVQCRRDTCRIVANFRSSSDASDWAVLYVTLMGSNYVTTSQPVFVKAPDGSTQMRLFASRKPPAGSK
ncbi:MAG: hypothetical protein QM719_03905 [Thermomonas sp.]